jgi:Flp pilus assembly pilin Flp
MEIRAAAMHKLLNRLLGERGQGTVEYVGLILLVSMLMVALVAAMKSFHTSEGQDLAGLIVTKIKSAVNALTFH